MGLTLFEISDREFLAICNDSEDADGWFTTSDIADYMTARDVNTHQIGSRLGWQANTYGTVRKHPSKPSTWKLTDVGYSVVKGVLNGRQSGLVEKLNPGEMVLITRLLAQKAFLGRSGASRSAGHMVRREFSRTREISRNGRGRK